MPRKERAQEFAEFGRHIVPPGTPGPEEVKEKTVSEQKREAAFVDQPRPVACRECLADLDVIPGQQIATCKICGTKNQLAIRP